MMKKDLQTHQIAFLKTIGSNISKYRKERGLSQSELGLKCDIDKPHVSRAESGQHNFTILTALKFSEALEIPVAKLFEI